MNNNYELFDKRLNVMGHLLLKIRQLKNQKDIEKFSQLLGGLIVFLEVELGKEPSK